MSEKFETLKVLYDENKIDDSGLLNALNKKWITEEEVNIIQKKEEPV